MEAQTNITVTPSNSDTVFPSGTNETPVAPVTETPKEEIPASRFAALARKQKQAEAASRLAKEERAKLDADKAELAKWRAEREAEQSAPKKRLSPIEALQSQGWSYADASAYVLNDEKPTPEHMVKEVESKFETYKREQEEKEAARVAKEKADAEAAQQEHVATFKSGITDFLTENKDTYELINLNLEPEEATNLIYNLIEAKYDMSFKEGKPVILSKEEAAAMLEEDLEIRIKKSMEAKKFKSKEQPADAQADKSSAVAAFTSKTLSNATTSTSSNPKSPAKNDNERFERALAALGKS